MRWFGLDGVEHSRRVAWSMSTPTVRPTTGLLDSDGDGLADRALSGEQAYVDTDGDGRWDVKLSDRDGDGRADGADELS